MSSSTSDRLSVASKSRKRKVDKCIKTNTVNVKMFRTMSNDLMSTDTVESDNKVNNNHNKATKSKAKYNKTGFTAETFTSMIRSSDYAICNNGLKEFLQKSKDGGDNKLINDYCTTHPSCSDLLLLMQNHSVKKTTLFGVIEHILATILRDFPQLKDTGVVLARVLISSHLDVIIRELFMTNTSPRIKSALKLLSAIIMCDPYSASELIISFKELVQKLQPLFSRKDIGDLQDVRTCVIIFIGCLLMTGDTLIIHQLIESREICVGLFNSIAMDKFENIHLILTSIKDKVLCNQSISKTCKVHMIKSIDFNNFTKLYFWRGQKSWNFTFPKDFCNQIDESGEGRQVADLAEEFVVLVCTSVRHGVLFHDPTFGTSPELKNKLVLIILKSHLRSLGSPRVQNIVKNVLQVCDDVIPHFVNHLLETSKTIENFDLIYQIMENSPDLPACLKHSGGVSIKDLESRLLFDLFPSPKIKSWLLSNFIVQSDVKQGEALIQGNRVTQKLRGPSLSLRIYLLILRRYDAISAALRQKSASDWMTYSNDDLEELADVLLRRANEWLPEHSVIARFTGKLSNSVQEMLASNIELGEVQEMLDFMTNLLQFFACLQTFHKNQSFYSTFQCLSETVGKLQKFAELKERDFNITLNVLRLQLIRLLVSQISVVRVDDLQPLFLNLLNHLNELKMDEKFYCAGQLIISKAFGEYDDFWRNRHEISIWLDTIYSFSDDSSFSNILAFVSKVFANFIGNHLKYGELLDSSIRKVNTLNSGSEIMDDLSISIDMILKLPEADVIRRCHRYITDNVDLDVGTVEFAEFSPLIMISLSFLSKNSTLHENVGQYIDVVLLLLLHYQSCPKNLFLVIQRYKTWLVKSDWLNAFMISYNEADYAKFKKHFDVIMLRNRELNFMTKLSFKILGGSAFNEEQWTTSLSELQNLCSDLSTFRIFWIVRAVLFYISYSVSHMIANSQMIRSFSRLLQGLLVIFRSCFRDEDIRSLLNSGKLLGDVMSENIDCFTQTSLIEFLLKSFLNVYKSNSGVEQRAVLNKLFGTVLHVFESETLSQHEPILQLFIDKLMDNFHCKSSYRLLSETLVLHMNEESFLTFAAKVFTKKFNSLVISDQDGGSSVSQFGLRIIKKFKNMFSGKNMSFFTRNAGVILKRFVDFSLIVKSRKVFEALNIFMRATGGALFIDKDVFYKLLAEIDNGSEELCKDILAQNYVLCNDIFSDRSLDMSLLTENMVQICLRRSSYLSTYVWNCVIKLCGSILINILSSEETDDDYLPGILKTFIERFSNKRETREYFNSVVSHANCKPLNAKQMTLLLTLLDQMINYDFCKRSDKNNFLVASLKHMSHKSSWRSTRPSTLNCVQHINSLFSERMFKLSVTFITCWNDVGRKTVGYFFKYGFDSADVLKFMRIILQHLYPDLKNPDISVADIFNLITSHSRFVATMLNTEQSDVKEILTDILTICIDSCQSLCDIKHLPIYLSSYNASVSLIDKKLLKLMQTYESSGIDISSLRFCQFGSAARDFFCVSNATSSITQAPPSAARIVDNFDADRLRFSSVNFPLSTIYEGLNCVRHSYDPKLKYTYDSVYDPCFVLPLMSHVLNSENSLDLQKFIEKGCLGYIVSGLSSYHPDIRSKAYLCLMRFYLLSETTQFYSQNIILALLKSLKHSLTEENQQLSCITTSFIRNVCLEVTDPGRDLYNVVSGLILRSPTLKLQSVPYFYYFFFNNGLDSKKCTSWILRVILEGLRTNLDFRDFNGKNNFTLLLTYYRSELSSSLNSQLVLQILYRAVQIPAILSQLVRNHDILTWICLSLPMCSNDRDVDTFYKILREFCDSFLANQTRSLSNQMFLLNLRLTLLEIIKHEIVSERCEHSKDGFILLLGMYQDIIRKSSLNALDLYPGLYPPITTMDRILLIFYKHSGFYQNYANFKDELNESRVKHSNISEQNREHESLETFPEDVCLSNPNSNLSEIYFHFLLSWRPFSESIDEDISTGNRDILLKFFRFLFKYLTNQTTLPIYNKVILWIGRFLHFIDVRGINFKEFLNSLLVAYSQISRVDITGFDRDLYKSSIAALNDSMFCLCTKVESSDVLENDTFLSDAVNSCLRISSDGDAIQRMHLILRCFHGDQTD